MPEEGMCILPGVEGRRKLGQSSCFRLWRIGWVEGGQTDTDIEHHEGASLLTTTTTTIVIIYPSPSPTSTHVAPSPQQQGCWGSAHHIPGHPWLTEVPIFSVEDLPDQL